MSRSTVSFLGIALSVLIALTVPAANAQESSAIETTATVAPSLSPDRLDSKGTLTLAIHYSGGEFGVPSPVRRSVLKLPAGLSLEIPKLRSCSPTRLRAQGARACPSQSEIGTGRALVEAHAGSQVIAEHLTLWVFLGPLENFQPTFEVLGQGETPLRKRVVLHGSVLPAQPPYGEELVMNIPPIATLPLEPDASLSSLTLTVGSHSHGLAHDANQIVLPGSCPPAGFPFAAEFTYADGSIGSAQATSRCPR
ncbi:MAG: hypothetical protein ACRDK2_17320 [Solirubrobacteraceae bacterium]